MHDCSAVGSGCCATRESDPRRWRVAPDGRCRGHLDRSMRASERRHDLGGEPPDALPGGLSAVKQDVLYAERAQGFEFCGDSVGRAVERARLSSTRCSALGRRSPQPGTSARREYERRKSLREGRARHKSAGSRVVLARAVTEPQSTYSWKTDVDGAHRTAKRLSWPEHRSGSRKPLRHAPDRRDAPHACLSQARGQRPPRTRFRG